MQLIGLTGNIGSGKSSTAKFFQELGYFVISADLLAREVLQEKSVIAEVSANFGDQVLKRGVIQPSLLAKEVFQNKENVAKMNNISHPRIQKKSLAKIKELYQKNNEVKILYDAPLLIEAGVYSKMQRTILVITSFENILQRLTQRALARRSSINAADVKKRMEYQIKPEEAKKHSDFIIDGNGDLESIHRQVEAIHQQLIFLPEITPQELWK